MSEDAPLNLSIAGPSNDENLANTLQRTGEIGEKIKDLNKKCQTFKNECEEWTRKINVYTVTSQDIKNDIAELNALRNKLQDKIKSHEDFEAVATATKEIELDYDLENIIEKKLRNYTEALTMYRKHEEDIDALKTNMGVLNRGFLFRNKEIDFQRNKVKELREEISDLEDRKKKINAEMSKINTGISPSILKKKDIPPNIMRGLKRAFDYKQKSVDNANNLVREANVRLVTVRNQYRLNVELLKTVTDNNNNFIKALSDKTAEMDELLVESARLQSIYKRYELQLNDFIPMQENYDLMQKFVSCGKQLDISNADLCQNEQIIVDYREKVNSHTLEMLKMESEVAALYVEKTQLQKTIDEFLKKN